MKKFGLIIAVTLLSATAFAEGTPSLAQPSIAIATVEAGVALNWETLDTEGEAPSHSQSKLEEQSRKLSEKLEAKVEQRLQEKLNRQLELAM